MSQRLGTHAALPRWGIELAWVGLVGFTIPPDMAAAPRRHKGGRFFALRHWAGLSSVAGCGSTACQWRLATGSAVWERRLAV